MHPSVKEEGKYLECLSDSELFFAHTAKFRIYEVADPNQDLQLNISQVLPII